MDGFASRPLGPNARLRAVVTGLHCPLLRKRGVAAADLPVAARLWIFEERAAVWP